MKSIKSSQFYLKPCEGLASHPVGGVGSSNILSRFMLQKPELSAGLMGLLPRMQTFPLPILFKLTRILQRYYFFYNRVTHWYKENSTYSKEKINKTKNNLHPLLLKID